MSMQVVLGFDMETDIGSWTPFYEGMKHGTPEILRLLDRHDVSATFFFTGDSAKHFPKVVRMVKDRGHEVGSHTLFHETIGDALYDIPGQTPVLPEEVPRRLELCTDLIEGIARVRPVSFRCPRLFGSSAVVNALDRLGYVADATYPLFYFRERLTPYHPDPDDWTKEGNLSIVELPNFADLSMESHDAYGRDRDQWPKFRTEGADAVLVHIDGYSRYCADRGVEPFLCFYFHPWEFHPMPEGEISWGEGAVRPEPFITQNCGPHAVDQLDRLVGALKARGAEFLQAKQAAERV